ncbi:hypothetical protein CTEN210_01854 [Chaetoceros tenuissimus]|uniref:Uncharacterized protein n=1 Tax=Chaetoceros tenuissimus TaxID=426638 RepID=A0AAD3H020_9STRA|nr:hypothetical protein CTEN210_01854 [Chaetoceros tenuissimus]
MKRFEIECNDSSCEQGFSSRIERDGTEVMSGSKARKRSVITTQMLTLAAVIVFITVGVVMHKKPLKSNGMVTTSRNLFSHRDSDNTENIFNKYKSAVAKAKKKSRPKRTQKKKIEDIPPSPAPVAISASSSTSSAVDTTASSYANRSHDCDETSKGKGGKGKGGKGKGGKGKGGKGKGGSDYDTRSFGGKGGKSSKGNKSRRLKSDKAKARNHSKGSSKGKDGYSKGKGGSSKGKGGSHCYDLDPAPAPVPSPVQTPVLQTPVQTPVLQPPTQSPPTDNGCVTWTLVADVEGENIGDYAAGIQGLKLSGNGLSLALASKFADAATGNVTDVGAVSVYEVLNGQWIMRGAPIYGADTNDLFGSSVSLSFDGNMLAVGSSNGGYVNIYDWDGSAWILRSTAGGLGADAFGMGVTLNDSGDRLVIGSHLADPNGLNDAGVVVVYEWNVNAWVQLGNPIGGAGQNDESGYAVDMNSSGDTIIIGASGHDGDTGHARVFSWDGSNWIQKGQDLDGASFGDFAGESVGINSSGDVVIVGSPYDDGIAGMDTGSVSIYEWNGSSWIIRDGPIEGGFMDDTFGLSVDINANGDIISVGGPGYDEGQASNAGHVRMYLWNGSTWDPIVQFPGEYFEDYAGTSVSLNSDGNCVAVGAEGHDNYYGDYDWNNGQARVICCLARR